MSSFLNKFSGSTRRVTLGLSLIQLFKAILAFFTVIISSTYFGTSIDRDVWLLSLAITGIIGTVIFGPFYQIFRVKLVMIKEGEGEEKALKSVGSLFMYMLIVSVLIIIASEVVPSLLSKSFAPNYTNEQQHFLKIMIRLITPTLLFSVIVFILSGVLNVYNVFYIPEIMAVLSTVLNVIIIVLFATKYGIYSLVLSNYLANIILIIVLLLAIKKNKINLIKNLNINYSYAIPFIKFALPFYFTYFISQILLAAERIISSIIGVGSVSVLDYARKFVTIPIDVTQGAVNSVLATSLSKIHIKEGEKGFIWELNKFINLMLLISLPIVTLFIICPLEIVQTFLLRGAFDPQFVNPTANCLFWFGFGIVSIVFYSTSGQALVAQGKNKNSVVIISGIMGFVILLINLLFYKHFGIQILAFSWSIVHFIAGLIMYFIISLNEFKLLFKEFARKMALLFIVIILCLLVYSLILPIIIIENSLLKSVTTMVIIGFFALSVELLFIYILKFKEKEIITNFISSYIYKGFNSKGIK